MACNHAAFDGAPAGVCVVCELAQNEAPPAEWFRVVRVYDLPGIFARPYDLGVFFADRDQAAKVAQFLQTDDDWAREYASRFLGVDTPLRVIYRVEPVVFS